MKRAIALLLVAAAAAACTPLPSPLADATLVRRCKETFTDASEVLRDRAGGLWLVNERGETRIAPGTPLGDVCAPRS